MCAAQLQRKVQSKTRILRVWLTKMAVLAISYVYCKCWEANASNSFSPAFASISPFLVSAEKTFCLPPVTVRDISGKGGRCIPALQAKSVGDMYAHWRPSVGNGAALWAQSPSACPHICNAGSFSFLVRCYTSVSLVGIYIGHLLEGLDRLSLSL